MRLSSFILLSLFLVVELAAEPARSPSSVRRPNPQNSRSDAGRAFFNRFSGGRARSVPRRRDARVPKRPNLLGAIPSIITDFFGAPNEEASTTPEQTPSTAIPPSEVDRTKPGLIGFSPESLNSNEGNRSGSGAGNGSGEGTGSGNGSQNKNDKNPGISKVGFNDSAPEGRDSVELRGSDNGRKGPGTGVGKMNPDGARVPHPLYKPVCFLFDPATAESANGIVKDFVDAYHSCQVVAVPFVFTIKSNYPNDPDTINNLAKQVCPLSSVLGANETSVQTHVKYDDTTDIMCGSFDEDGNPTKNVAGCAVFIPPRHGTPDKDAQDSINNFQNSQNTGGTHFGGSAQDGKEAVSIVDVDARDSMVAIHEVQHNNGGVNTGEGDGTKQQGFGIESPGKRKPGSDAGNFFTGEGCAHVRSASNPNDGTYAYEPDRTIYHTPIDNPRLQYDLMAGRSFFDSGAGPPPLSPIPPPNNPGDLPLANAEGARTRVVNTKAPGSKIGKLNLKPGAESKHKKKRKGQSGPGISVNPPARTTKENPLSESDEFFAGVGQKPGEEATKSIGFNDKADEDSEALSDDFFSDGDSTKSGPKNGDPDSILDENYFTRQGEEGEGDEAANRLLSSLDEEKRAAKSSADSKLDENFFDEDGNPRKKKKNGEFDSTISKKSGKSNSGNSNQISAISDDTSLFKSDSNLFEKGFNFIESVSESLGGFLDEGFFNGSSGGFFGNVKGEGDKSKAQPRERVRVIGKEQIYQE